MHPVLDAAHHQAGGDALMCRTPCLDPFRHLHHQLIDLPCGCQDVHYACGCVCREHQHVHCDGQPATHLEETR